MSPAPSLGHGGNQSCGSDPRLLPNTFQDRRQTETKAAETCWLPKSGSSIKDDLTVKWHNDEYLRLWHMHARLRENIYCGPCSALSLSQRLSDGKLRLSTGPLGIGSKCTRSPLKPPRRFTDEARKWKPFPMRRRISLSPFQPTLSILSLFNHRQLVTS